MINPTMPNFEFAPAAAIKVVAALSLSLFSSVLLLVAISASVKPVPFRQVSRASGRFDESGDESD